MSDAELLEWAARAAGYDIKPHPNRRAIPSCMFTLGSGNWNPLADDGDALRLAVALGLDICPYPNEVTVFRHEWKKGHCVRCSLEITESWGEDRTAATRRAIVRAAAEIGRAGA